MSQKSTFFANGKLLLTAEYLVLDGALALALPTTRFGQNLTITTTNIDTNTDIRKGVLHWRSLDETGAVWLQINLDTPNDFGAIPNENETHNTTDIDGLIMVLRAARQLNPLFLNDSTNITATTTINYPRAWGLGSSSTLVAAVAEWAGVNAFALNDKTFRSSGYDVACANQKQPILFQKMGNKNVVKSVNFAPDFSDEIYFIYLNKKQNSRDGIKYYRTLNEDLRADAVTKLDIITKKIIEPTLSKTDFIALLTQHEKIISDLLQLPTVKAALFPDFDGAVKSLGAWGGDFVLAIANKNTSDTRDYFTAKGYETVLRWSDMF